MHLGNGQVTMMCAVYAGAVATCATTAALLMARKCARPDARRLAAATGFVFAMQALNLPAMPGISGHLLGGVLLAYWFGPTLGFLSTSLVLLVQSVLLGDGAWQTLGCNLVNMALIPCLVVVPLWRHLFGEATGALRYATIGVAAYLSVVLASLVCAMELAAGGTMGPMLLSHVAIGGIEVLATLAAVAIAPRLSMAWAPLAVGGALAAAVWGSSPWPDGLEYTLAQRGWAFVETLPLVTLDGTIALVVGCVIVTAAGFALARVSPNRRLAA